MHSFIIQTADPLGELRLLELISADVGKRQETESRVIHIPDEIKQTSVSLDWMSCKLLFVNSDKSEVIL